MSLDGRAPVVPSIVYFGPDESVVIGDVANRQALTEPTRFARELKRRIGDTTSFGLGARHTRLRP